LPRPEAAIPVLKAGFESNRCSGHLHGVVYKTHDTDYRLGTALVFRAVDLNLHPGFFSSPVDLSQILLWNGKGHIDRLNLMNGQEGLVFVVPFDQISSLNQKASGPSGDGRTNGTVSELQLEIFQGGLIRFDERLGCLCGAYVLVKGLPAHNVFFRERHVSPHIVPCLSSQRLVPFEPRLGLLEGHFIRRFINREKKISFLHFLAFLKMNPHELARNTGFHGYGRIGLYVADRGDLHGHILCENRCHRDRHGRLFFGFGLLS